MAASAPRRTIDVIDRRIGLLFGLFVLLLLAGILRAGYLGLLRGSALRAAAVSEQVQTTVIPAQRGEITDRSGTPLALSEPTDLVTVDPYLIRSTYKNPQKIAAALAPLIGMPPTATLAAITKPRTGYVKLGEYVPAASAAKIMALGINGINDYPTERRLYPGGTEAAQVVGWAGDHDNGLTGIEGLFNPQLAGVSGIRRTVLDGQGKPISVTSTKPMIPGENIQLTLSGPLQAEVEQVIDAVGNKYHAQGVTAIVSDPQTDQLLAVANWPQVNASDPAATAFQSVNGHVPAAEDQAVDMSYEPGSTFKVVTVGGALQEGLVTPSSPFTIPPYLSAYGKQIYDAEMHGTETLTVAQILKVSSNIGADLIARRLGPVSFARWVKRFGFGRATGVDLPGEQIGIVLPESKYNGLSMYNMPFGQGVSVTPMQMVQAYDAVADGGILRTPQIIESIGGRRVRAPHGRRIVSARVARQLRGMLRGVLTDGGTASGAAIPGYDMAGKTGTAQVAVDGKYSATEFIASFIGMVPASDPKLVVAVVVNDPQGVIYGGSVAAPAFQQIVGWAVPHFGIDPCPAPCPASAFSSAAPNSL
ncbi:MAG: peptidoglycan D,D-transpeptidase FtsI family protein [Solirubrobacteraceae bacterium]